MLNKPQLARIRAYQTPSDAMAAWQIFSTFGLYLFTIAAMYVATDISVWLTLALSAPAAGLIVRIFMLQHDCGHNALFRSARFNWFAGGACSLVTLTPFAYWRRLHARHHGMWNNLDKRGIPADFYSDCLTLAEYRALGPARRWLYRTTHHPLLIHMVLPSVIFMVLYRLPFDTPRSCRREHLSVYLLNFSLVGVFTTLVLTFELSDVLLVHLPSIALAATIGIWLFSVQHRFEEAQWTRQQDWNLPQAALHGTSYLKLPRVLQWFSGNIGFHHMHHLRPGIPNYRLQASHEECPDISGAATVLTLRDALRAPSFVLWDEDLEQMVPFPSR
ncbi:fatty acid desaturase [Roseomonas mucosa]|uniref:fatty acid desaturase family protein n=1 Tax=Roseomonas mucosa TaxID=207340 RepID=UPI0030D3F472